MLRIWAGFLFICCASLSSSLYAANCPDDTNTAVINDVSCTVVGSLSTITLNFTSGFTDNTARAAVGGNPGATVGQQRKRSFIKAAKVIGDSLQYTVAGSTLVVDANFSALSCNALSATLGTAGATTYTGLGISGASWAANTFYPIGLWSELNGSDQKSASGETADINANFNANIGSTGCLENSGGWYYGYDSPPVNSTGFVTVLLHEMTHGLGFAGLVDPTTGSKGASGWDDIYSTHLFDVATASTWPSLSDGQRAASATSDTGLLWNGDNVNAQAIGNISAGFQNNDIDTAFTSGDKIQMYAPAVVNGGSSVSHFNTSVSPNELMEPQYTEGQNTLGLALYLLQDLGWGITGPNTAPTLAAVNQTTNEDVVTVVDLSAWGFDADSDALTYSVNSCASNITCSITGTDLTLTPALNHNGSTHVISIGVSDGQAMVTDSFNLQVVAQNDDPVWSTIPTLELLQGNSSSVTLINFASDVDLDSLSFSTLSCGTSLVCSINANSLTITAPQTLGMQSISVQVSDSNGGIVATNFNVNVSLNNTAPTFTIPNQLTNEDIPLTLSLSDYSNDINNDALTYELVSCGNNFSCSLIGDQLLLTPDLNQSGGSSISVSVSDGVETVSTAFSVVIISVNDAPLIEVVNDAGVLINSTEVFALTITDAESDPISVSLSASSFLNASISGNNLTMTPSQAGVFEVSIIASDGVLQTIHRFNVTVYDGLSLSQGGQIFTNGDTVNITNELHDIVLVGGSNSYNYQLRYEGQSVDELLVNDAGQIQIAMPSSGAFAGIYELTVTDQNFNETLVVNLVRPLRLMISSASILDKDESQWIAIEGGVANTEYTLSLNSGVGSTFRDTAEQLTNTFFAPDESESFNAVRVMLINEDVSGQSDVSVLVSSIYSDITQEVSVFPGAMINLQVNDLSGQGVAGAVLVLVQHEHHQTYNLPVSYVTGNTGSVQVLVPDDFVAYSAVLTALNYMPHNLTLIGSELSMVIELQPAAIPMQISGQITATGDLDFSLALPRVLLTLDSGTLIDIPVTFLSVSQGVFETVIDLNQGSPTTLNVSHALAETATLDLTGLTQDQNVEISLVESVQVVQPDPEPSSPTEDGEEQEAEVSAGGDSSTGSAGYLLMLMWLLLFKGNWQNRR